jgi:hypothetical protein
MAELVFPGMRIGAQLNSNVTTWTRVLWRVECIEISQGHKCGIRKLIFECICYFVDEEDHTPGFGAFGFIDSAAVGTFAIASAIIWRYADDVAVGIEL